ncbi:DNA-binding virion core protein [Equine molluscum contagiosum-like virus]|nr:DNA-binding virion core protein [Equine molluscum contagiosum-like virus]
MNPLLENLFEEHPVCAGGVSREEFLLVVAGARVKFPRSLLSLYRIVPRTMSRFELSLLQSETLTGVVFTTAYNVRRNLGLDEGEPLSPSALEGYYLHKENEVLTLMVNNTNFASVTAYRARGRRLANPVVFRAGAVPLALVFSSRRKIDTYKEDLEQAREDSTYTRIPPNVAVASKYAGMVLVDVHTPATALLLTAVYGLGENHELRKLSSGDEVAAQAPLAEPMRLDTFREVFEAVKRHIPLTNLERINE